MSVLRKICKYSQTAYRPLLVLSAKSITAKFCNAPTVTEKQIHDLLKGRFKSAKEIVVEDASGGCGAMFNIHVETKEFKGLSIVKQHKAITETLKDQIKQIHGLRISTKVAT